MKTTCLWVLFMLTFCMLRAQEPNWLDINQRKIHFSEDIYFTGFAYFEVSQAHILQSVVQQAKNEAQADLSKKIRIRITSVTQNTIAAQTVNGQYDETELFRNQSATATDTEVVGIKTDTYYDTEARLAYAFAYVKKSDLSNYYKSMIETLVQQAEGLLNVAIQLEEDGEKYRARTECEQTAVVLDKIYYAQDILAAVNTGEMTGLQLDRVEAVYKTSTQLSARLSQGVFLCVESDEDLFGRSRQTVASKVKSQLADHGCSFVEDAEQADYKLRIDALARLSSEQDGIVSCYADINLELYDIRKQRVVFSDEISQKGSSLTKEKAGSKAFDNAVPKIVDRLKKHIK